MTIPAELGESQTSSFSSRLSGTSPKDEPSIRMYADLRLDVVADDRQPLLLEAALPVGLAGDEHRHAVHHRAARFEHLLRVPLGGGVRANGQVVDDDVGLSVLQNSDDVVGLAGRLG